jgi:hypothetical protein
VPFRKLSVTPRETTAAIIIAVLFGLLCYDYDLRWEAERRVTYFPDDMPLINRAVDLWVVENNQPRKQVWEQSFPIVVRFRHETCVVLQLKLFAAVGGDPIYCFDPKTKKLTRADLSHAD